jgi:hypothetical protein
MGDIKGLVMTTKFELICENFSAIFIAQRGIILAIEQNYYKPYLLNINHVLKDFIGKPYFTLFRLDIISGLRLTPLKKMKEISDMTVDTVAASMLAQIDGNMGDIKPDLEKAEESVGGRTLPLGHQSAVVKIASAKLGPSKSGPPNINVQAVVVEDVEGSKTTTFAGIKVGWNFWFGKSTKAPFNQIDPFGKGMMVPTKDGTREYYCRSTLEEFYGLVKRVGLEDKATEAIEQGKMTIAYTALVNAIDKGLFVVINNGRNVYKGETDKLIIKPVENGYSAPDEVLFEQPEGNEPATKEQPVSANFEPGDRVQSMNNAFGDGESYSGHYLSDDGSNATVKWDDDGSEDEISLDNIRVIDSSTVEQENEIETTTEESQEVGFVVGQIVTSNSNYEHGAGYEGTIEKITGENNVLSMAWEDGTKEVIDNNCVDAE